MKKRVVRMARIGLILALVGFSACSTTYQTQSVSQPVTLSGRVGIRGTDIPSTSKPDGMVEGKVCSVKLITSTSSYIEEKGNADVDFLGCLKTFPNRCITNVRFEVTNYQYIGFGGGKAIIEYTGECRELPSKQE
jgi:hypothetical protein